MTSTAHQLQQETAVAPRPPAWCGQQAVRCTGSRHRSVAIKVELDQDAGCEVRTSLRGSTERIFIEVEFVSGRVLDEWATRLSCLEAAAGPGGTVARLEAPAAPPGKAVVSVNPLDPAEVADPHGHSLSVEQAEILGGVLQYLVRAARGGDAAALRAGAKLP